MNIYDWYVIGLLITLVISTTLITHDDSPANFVISVFWPVATIIFIGICFYTLIRMVCRNDKAAE